MVGDNRASQMLAEEVSIRDQVNHDLDCTESSLRLMGMRAELATLIGECIALAEVPRRACHEGYCSHHVQAIIVSIDQHAERALGNRAYFLNRSHGIGWSKKGDVP
jgi:hypothetical protein